MSRNTYLFVLVLVVAACKEQAPNYCADVPVTHNCLDDAAVPGSDATPACTGDSSCSGATPVCNLGVGVCVQCSGTDDAACTGTTPVCGSDDTCEACTAHIQCTSDVCRPDGSCSDGTDVAYVTPTGSGTACTQAAPCGTMANALATARAYVKVAGALNEQSTINNQNVVVLADPGASLSETSVGVIFTVTGSSQVSIYDLAITGALGSASVGISMPAGNTAALELHQATVSNGGGVGISTVGGTLSVDQSTISENAGGGLVSSGGTLSALRSRIINNTGGGLSLSATQFTIVNNFIAGNGASATTNTVGGVNFETISSGGNQFDFNTVTANTTAKNVNSGVNCGTVTVSLLLRDNIIYGNLVSGAGSQFGGGAGECTTTYSDIGPDTVSGTGNINQDPAFVNAGQGDYHLAAGSPCIDVADPAATLDVDIDGDTRPQGSGRDIGADEYKP